IESAAAPVLKGALLRRANRRAAPGLVTLPIRLLIECVGLPTSIPLIRVKAECRSNWSEEDIPICLKSACSLLQTIASAKAQRRPNDAANGLSSIASACLGDS